MRRAHDFLSAAHPGQCPKCGTKTSPHQICGYCGYYRGTQVIMIDTEPETAEEKK